MSTRLIVGVIVLAGATVWLTLTNDAAPAVLVGTGLVLAVDGWSEVVTDRRTHHHDLDETRRLLYMALSIRSGTSARPLDLAGSLSNALAHHSKLLIAADADRLGQAIAGGGTLDQRYVEQMQKLVADLTTKLGDPAPDK